MSLVTGILSARALGVTGRGQLAAIMLWPTVFSGLFAFGIPSALNYHARRNPENERSLFLAALTLCGIASIAMLAVGMISIPLALHAYGARTVDLARIFLLAAPQFLFSYAIVAHLLVRGWVREANAYRLLPTLATLISLIVLSSLKALTPLSAALSYIVPTTPAFIIALILVLRGLQTTAVALVPACRALLSYATRAFGIDLLGALSSQVDQLMVVSFLDPASMGAYVVALSVSRVPNVITIAMLQVLSPRAAALDGDGVTAIVGRCMRVGSASVLVSALFLAAALPFVLPRLFGSGFAGSVASSRLLLGELVFTSAATLLAEAFKGVGRPEIVTIVQAVSLVASVVFLFVLVPRLGIAGAALALLIAAVVRLGTLLALYKRIVGVAPPKLVLDAQDVRFVSGLVRSQLRPRAAC